MVGCELGLSKASPSPAGERRQRDSSFLPWSREEKPHQHDSAQRGRRRGRRHGSKVHSDRYRPTSAACRAHGRTDLGRPESPSRLVQVFRPKQTGSPDWRRLRCRHEEHWKQSPDRRHRCRCGRRRHHGSFDEVQKTKVRRPNPATPDPSRSRIQNRHVQDRYGTKRARSRLLRRLGRPGTTVPVLGHRHRHRGKPGSRRRREMRRFGPMKLH